MDWIETRNKMAITSAAVLFSPIWVPLGLVILLIAGTIAMLAEVWEFVTTIVLLVIAAWAAFLVTNHPVLSAEIVGGCIVGVALAFGLFALYAQARAWMKRPVAQ